MAASERSKGQPNTKKVVSASISKNLFLQRLLIFSSFHLFQECIQFEIEIADKASHFISLYRSPSKSDDRFESFADNFELHLDSIVFRNPYLIIVLGDFNAHTKGWQPLAKTTYEGTRIDVIRSQFGLERMIHEPAHITEERSSCTRCPIFFASKLPSPNS